MVIGRVAIDMVNDFFLIQRAAIFRVNNPMYRKILAKGFRAIGDVLVTVMANGLE